MTTPIRRWTTIAVILALPALAGCSSRQERVEPGLEETSTSALASETEAVAEWVRSARSHLPADPAAALLLKGGLVLG